ncbi:MAG: DUF2254 domain-containing protein [Gammaproteobacteria bacterium]|nr:DUF2254 domain-containing protein [Gammaproteobacteria bacterium]
MKTYLMNILAYIRASYWFIPLMMAILAILLALTTTSLDWWLNQAGFHNNTLFFANQPQGARAILSTIAGSMITVAGVTFSITIMAVSFALGQIGPRLIHSFMRDKVNQYTLGTFIATFLYCLLVLRLVLNGNEWPIVKAFVPHISVFTAMLLAIFNIAVFIFFIHHIASSFNVYNILAKIGLDLTKMIDKEYPLLVDLIADPPLEQEKNRSTNFSISANPIFPNHSGYIRIFDIEGICNLSVEKECVIEIKRQPGDFVTLQTPLMYINKEMDEETQKSFATFFAIGQERDQSQDFLLLSDEIAEIIARALSPGINDPFTAITAINWLQSSIELFSTRQIQHKNKYDKNNKIRVIMYPVTLSIYLERIFGQIFPYVSRDRNTSLHMIKVIKEMFERTANTEFMRLLNSQAHILAEMTKDKLQSPQDHGIFDKRFNEVKKLYELKM